MIKSNKAVKKKSWITYSPDDSEYGINDIILTNLYPRHTEYNIIKQVCKELKIQIWTIDDTTDIGDYPHFMIILDPYKFSNDDSEILTDMLKLYDVKEYSVLFTKAPAIKLHPKLRKYTLKQPKVFNYENLKLIILNKRSSALRHYAQHIRYDKKFYRMFYILFNLMAKTPDITTKKLCEVFEVSEKTIQRDMAMLNILGNDIIFNKQTRQWELESSIYKIEFDKQLNKSRNKNG